MTPDSPESIVYQLAAYNFTFSVSVAARGLGRIRNPQHQHWFVAMRGRAIRIATVWAHSDTYGVNRV